MAEKTIGSLTDQELEELVEKVLATLTPREQEIFAMRFGIQEEVDVQEIGRRFEATRKRIREIELKALKSIRRSKKPKPS
ncbi:MAG: hypothetical protein G01um101429_497 [Parcubacteria group bacterium Gr01-1014_29]|nr:MAG: hypothetical protein G01um101429_497 [Parcubacteria group bacterium Gr01-1014_29]